MRENIYHTIGDFECKGCCCRPYKCRCGGAIHQEVADEVETSDGDWEWVHYTKCDKCGEEYNYDAEKSPIELRDSP